MSQAYSILQEMDELGLGTGAGCAHPRELRGVRSRGAYADQVCDPNRGGCGAVLGSVGGKR